MEIGYARTSTTEQNAGYEAQIEALNSAGVNRIFKEQVSSVAKRAELEAALDYLRDGDALVVTKLDRLARNVRHLGEIIEAIEAKGAGLRILDLNLDTRTATGKLILNIMGSIAQFEREMMLERQREGIAKARKDGKYKGRQPTPQDKCEEVIRLAKEEVPKAAIARRLGIGRTTVHRIINDAAVAAS